MTKMTQKLLISFFGPSCSGKSSCYQYAENYLRDRGYNVFCVNVAYPLRCIQSFAYEMFGKENQDPNSMDFKQDGQMLGFLAKHFEDRLGSVFDRRIKEILVSNCDKKIAIINTDCRNNAYETLREIGFVFVKMNVQIDILTDRRLSRGDLTPFDYKSTVEQYDVIKESYTIQNGGTFEELDKKVQEVLDNLI